MTGKIKHLVNIVKSIAHERYKAQTRSSRWPAVEKAHLKASPTCKSCGDVKRLQVHHIAPYRLHPERELDSANLITLCMGLNECHLLIGHGDEFRCYNPNVESDAAILLVNPQLRAEYVLRAKAARLT